jgi:hypothetical protein
MTSSPNFCWGWIHLSDIHFGHGDPRWASDQSDVVSALSGDIAALILDGAPRPNGLVITGDIAFSGGVVKLDEYDRALALIDDLRSQFEIETVLAVPGNHDVQRTIKAGPQLRLVKALRNESERVEDSLVLPADGQELSARFANYNKFISSVGGPAGPSADGQWEHTIDLGTGDRLRFVGWNTALLSNDDTDDGCLQVGRDAMNRSLRPRDELELVILLTHHPLESLTPRERAYASSRVFSRVDAHLHGHVHGAQNVLSVRGSGDSLVTITAGAAHADEDVGGEQTPHRYNMAAIRTEGSAWSLRVWPRRWSEASARWMPDIELTDGKSTYVDLQLRSPDDFSSQPDELGRLSGTSLTTIGRRRTAFPTDLSVAECIERNLIVEPAIAWSGSSPTPASSDVVNMSLIGSVLVLGAPGSGKTVLLTGVGMALAESGRRPLVVDIGRLPTDNPTLLDVFLAIDTNSSGVQVGPLDDVVILIDGIDESLAQGLDAESIASRIASLGKIATLIATCRKDEFERILAAHLPNDLFVRVGALQPWRVDVEFPTYIDRLAEAGLVSSRSLVDLVTADPKLQRLAERPLYARMLTLVAEDGALPDSSTSLYRRYLSKLASLTDSDLKRVGGASLLRSFALWQGVCWGLHGSFHRDRTTFQFDRMLQIAEGVGVTAKTASRSLAGLVDVEPVDMRATFIHYSFYEFLVASAFAETICAHSPDAESVARSLEVDFPIEIRRHAARILSSADIDPNTLIERLAIAFAEARGFPDAKRQTVGNLAAYLLCRIGGSAGPTIANLLSTEGDPFLRNSLWWALARSGDSAAAEGYLAELLESPSLREMNRGYLLYYYGDISASAGPPFMDAAPFADWSHTRAALLEKFASKTYGAVPRGRAIIDVFTVLDLLRVRRESDDAELVAEIDARLTSLAACATEDNALARVSQMRAELSSKA